jgi:hypothetical protein
MKSVLPFKNINPGENDVKIKLLKDVVERLLLFLL